MIGYHQQSEAQICGDFSKVTVYWEYYPHTLEKELDKRHARQEYLTEPELWYILDSVVSVLSFLEQYKIYHGDIRPVNVLLTPEGHVKIADHGLVHSDRTGYVKALSGVD